MTTKAPRRDAPGASRRKVKVLPTARPTPPPKAKPNPKPVYRCNSGKSCPAYAELGKAEKIRSTKGEKGYCDRCLARRGDRATKDLEARRAGGAPRTHTA